MVNGTGLASRPVHTRPSRVQCDMCGARIARALRDAPLLMFTVSAVHDPRRRLARG